MADKKRKYSPFNPTFTPIDKGGVDLDKVKKADTPTGTPTVSPSTPSAPQLGSQWKEEPTFRDEQGNVKPEYKSGKASNAASGARYGASIRTGNPLFDSGAMIGGAIGGLFNKNLAGKEKYLRDIQEVGRQNTLTQAHQRFLDQAEQVRIAGQREQRLADQTNARLAIQEETNKRKGRTDTTNSLVKLASVSSPQARYEINSQLNSMWGLDSDPSMDFGATYSTQKFGDFAYIFDKHTGELLQATDDVTGEPVSAISTPQQIRALGAWMKLSDKEDGNLETALKQADEYISKNFKGGIKPNQYNSLKMQLAREIMNNKDTNNSTGKVTIGGKIYGIPDLPIFGQQNNPAPLAGDSAFMPTNTGVSNPVIDAATGKPFLQPDSVQLVPKLPDGVKPDTKYLQSDGSYLMFDSKTNQWKKFIKK